MSSFNIQTMCKQTGQTHPLQSAHAGQEKEIEMRVNQASQEALNSTANRHHPRKQKQPQRSLKQDALKLIPKPEPKASLPERAEKPTAMEEAEDDSSSSFDWDNWLDVEDFCISRKRVTRSAAKSKELRFTSQRSIGHKRRQKKIQNSWTQNEKERLLKIVQDLNASQSTIELNPSHFWKRVAKLLGTSRSDRACQSFYRKIFWSK